MRTDDEAAAAADTEAPASAPADKPAKPAKAKAAAKAKKAGANGQGNGAAKAPRKAAKPAADKPAKAKAAKAAPKAERQRDPAKLDRFGFRKGSIKSNAAAIYAKGRGATLGEVKAEVGSVQFNLLAELEGKGFQVERSDVKNDAGRVVTRYKLHPKEA